jgi:molybdenum cofactor biosynthesis enzyme MoaA
MSFGVEPITTIVDVTYLCNATCRYCQWGDPATPGRLPLPVDKVLLPDATLRALGTRRIVLSGGEPRLHPRLKEILGHYRWRVEEVVLITNGYGLGSEDLAGLKAMGVTGVTFSLDSLDPEIAFRTRRTPSRVLRSILDLLSRRADQPSAFELGINAVVSHPTANWGNAGALLDFGAESGLNFVKFQPIFDDGFVSRSDPALLLARSDADSLAKVAGQVAHRTTPLSNPPQFWMDLAELICGRRLPSKRCVLGSCRSILTHGDVGICYWLEASRLGPAADPLTPNELNVARARFDKAKQACTVSPQCFCTQPIDHTWLDPHD